jgi:hypothetical protein
MKQGGAIRLLLILLSCWIAANPLLAAETIKVNRRATYLNNTVGSVKMQSECNLDTQIIDGLVRYAKGKVEITDQDLSQVSGPTLNIVITNAFAAGGGGWSGPKWANAHATLRQGNRVLDDFEVYSKSNGGGHMTACGVLTKIGNALGAKVARRLLRSGKSAVRNKDEDDADKADAAEDAEP